MKKNALILLVAVAISTVSCVDNAVSPQVEAIRSQQVEWMKAKTAGEVLANANTAALAAYTAAGNAITLKGLELTYAQKVAANEEALIEAKYRMTLAKAAYDKSLVDLADAALASGDANAVMYLENYNNAAEELAKKIGVRLGLQEDLVTQQLLLTSSPDQLKDYIELTQKNLDLANLDLIAQKEILAIYKDATTGNSTESLKAERITLTAENQTLFAKVYNSELSITRTELVRQPLVSELDTKVSERSSLNSPADDKRIAVLTTEINALIAEIAPLSVSIDASQESINSNFNSITNNSNVINALSTAISRLENNDSYLVDSMTTISSLVASTELNITNLETDITNLTADLLIDTQKEAIAGAEKVIVSTTKKIATADIAIIAQEKIVAYWKGLLDKIFTA